MTLDQTPASWIVAVCNQKGGVGKSTLTLALAAATADSAGQALVVDVDPQASATSTAEGYTDPGFDYTHELRTSRLSQLHRLRRHDLLLVDAPGSLEDTEVLEQVLEHADFALLPFINESMAREPTERTSALATRMGVPHAAVINRVDSRGGGDAVIDARQELADRGVPYFRSFVRAYTGYSDSVDAGKTIYQWRARYGSNMREDISRVHGELQRGLANITNRKKK